MSARILIVDDSPILRLSIRRGVAQSGIGDESIFEAGNGQEALDVLEKEEVDLILLDLNMPVMDGETFARELRKDESKRDIIIVVVSTESNQERLSRLSDLGIRGYLHKPFEPEDLRELAGELLQEATTNPTMDPLSIGQVAEVVSHALESIAFLLAEPEEGQDAASQEYSQHARIGYTGPNETSDVWLSATDGFLIELASNLIGVDPSEVTAESEGAQALTELANIVCGEVVKLLGSETIPFEMGLPEVVSQGSLQSPDSTSIECMLGCNGEYLRVLIFREQA